MPEVVGWLHEVVWDDGASYSYHSSEPRPIPPTPGLVSQRIGRAAMLAAASEAPPAAAVPADVLALLRDLEPALDAYERSGRKSEIKDGVLHWTLNARHYDAQRLRGRVDAMLAAAERKGGES